VTSLAETYVGTWRAGTRFPRLPGSRPQALRCDDFGDPRRWQRCFSLAGASNALGQVEELALIARQELAMALHELVLLGRQLACVRRGSERKRTRHATAGVEGHSAWLVARSAGE